MKEYCKWVACWGNATSIINNKECMYAKDLTLRYPIKMCFSGSRLRFHFSNITGTETVRLRANVSRMSGKKIISSSLTPICYQGSETITIQAQTEICSDEVVFAVEAGEQIAVSIYLEGYTQMYAGVLITGPLSGG